MSENTADAIYDILVREAGAWDQPIARHQFIHAFTVNDTWEYRFQGRLGFGGKFWNYDRRWYVTCYPEDETPERLAIIERVNTMLAALRRDSAQEVARP